MNYVGENQQSIMIMLTGYEPGGSRPRTKAKLQSDLSLRAIQSLTTRLFVTDSKQDCKFICMQQSWKSAVSHGYAQMLPETSNSIYHAHMQEIASAKSSTHQTHIRVSHLSMI
jgi:hypothetical protein